MKKKSQLNQKIEAVTPRTLVVGIDIAKEKQWARFVDCRGVECGKAMYFSNDRTDFEAILAKIREISKKNSFADAIVGMEPTGHYWKALANYLMKQDCVHVVLVNPYHTKKAKELDDNSQTKSDKKDALTIARLVKDGRYSEVYLPHDIYADLRVLTTARNSVNRQKNALENTILAVLDEYFPEFTRVFKHPFKGKAAMQMLKAKLYLLKQQEAEAKLSGIRGEVTDIGWGNQIRSYVMQPYTMVKDHRTSEETGNVDAVLDGDIDPFINAYLKWIALSNKPAEQQ